MNISDETAKKLLDRVKQDSTCLREQVGCFISDDIGNIYATGSNRVPSNGKKCDECFRIQNNIPSGKEYESCRAVHAETNAILDYFEQSSNGSTIVPLLSTLVLWVSRIPCVMCANTITNVGIHEVRYFHKPGEEEKYISNDLHRELLSQIPKLTPIIID
ncbi:MAG: cytidine deaminase [Alphaproteobacteria bacterium]|nr:cytidine deaminase [Alphaproteobacteria bacterium]